MSTCMRTFNTPASRWMHGGADLRRQPGREPPAGGRAVVDAIAAHGHAGDAAGVATVRVGLAPEVDDRRAGMTLCGGADERVEAVDTVWVVLGPRVPVGRFAAP